MRIRALGQALPALVVAISLGACAPSPGATPTALATRAAPTAAPVAAPSATPDGRPFTFNGVQVTLPASVASGASGRLVAAANEPGAPEFAIHPAYVEIKLAGYPAQSERFGGIIQVFPVAEYERMSKAAAQRVPAMRALLAQRPAAPAGELPVLPVYNEAQALRAQVRYLAFQNGSGVRWVTFFAQGLVPATNKDVLYTYQGLTADGAYWVSAILPVKLAYLPADANSAGKPPAGGVAFPDLANANEGQVRAYYQAVAEKLDATAAGEFTPGLDALDALVQSLTVTAP